MCNYSFDSQSHKNNNLKKPVASEDELIQSLNDNWFISHSTFSKTAFKTPTCDLVLVLRE